MATKKKTVKKPKANTTKKKRKTTKSRKKSKTTDAQVDNSIVIVDD